MLVTIHPNNLDNYNHIIKCLERAKPDLLELFSSNRVVNTHRFHLLLNTEERHTVKISNFKIKTMTKNYRV